MKKELMAIRIEKQLKKRLVIEAKADHRTLTSYLLHIIENRATR